MKKLLAILTLGLFAASCGNTENNEQTTANVPTEPVEISAPGNDTMCFVHTEGIDNIDSTFVKLVVNGKQVDGTMLWFPAEKDRRMGHIRGTYTNGTINAGWVYEQEGMKQNLDVSFKLENGQLSEKPHVVNPKLGIEELPDTGAYTIQYTPIDCSRFPDRLIRLQELPNVMEK